MDRVHEGRHSTLHASARREKEKALKKPMGSDDVVADEPCLEAGVIIPYDSEIQEDHDDDRDDVDDDVRDDSPKAKKKRTPKVKPPDARVTNNIGRSGPFPGGPCDNSLLKNFYDHIALKIWLGQVCFLL